MGRGLLPALPIFVELGGAEEAGPAALAAQCAAGVARVCPHDASGALGFKSGFRNRWCGPAHAAAWRREMRSVR